MRLVVILAVVMLALAACAGGSSNAADSFQTLPPGDAARGAELFTQAISGTPQCLTCHTLDGTTNVGPSLQGFAARAATRVAGLSAEDYTYASITRPPAYLVSGFGNLMYNQYAQRLQPQQIADLIAYLLTL